MAKTESRWTLTNTGNRIMWAVIAAFLTWLVTRGVVLPLAIGATVFLVLTAIANRRD